MKKEIELAEKRLQLVYQASLFNTCKFLLGYKDVTEKTHGEIIETLENATNNKLICVPRGCLKSTIACVAYPIWLLNRNPNLRILIDSELYTNSSTFLREIKGLLTSHPLISVFGEYKTKVWNESEIIIKQRTKNLKEGSITCSGIGATKVGQHFDVIIMDDLNSDKNTMNDEQADKVINHYKMQTSILEPTGTKVVIGTRYSAKDLIGHILDNEINVKDDQLDDQGLIGAQHVSTA